MLTSDFLRDSQLASAGFHNTPLPGATDTCACIYCDIQLDGWTKSDDPEWVVLAICGSR